MATVSNFNQLKSFT